MELSFELVLLLFATGLLAGFVDSIAGGGGLLTVPVLLWTGMPPAMVLGTNKLQGSIGTLTSSFNFYRNGHVPLRSAALSMVCAFVGSALGTYAVRSLDASLLSRLLPLLLILFALYFLFSPRVNDIDAQHRIGRNLFALTAGFGIGFYDGFFGPGAGAFYVMAHIALLGYGIVRATAHTKVLNFASNISALLFFQIAGLVSWPIGLSMGAGQVFGSYLGSHLSMRHGVRLIKPVLVITSTAISLKLLFDNWPG
ncbi:MAG: TSUP family transporter [Chromatiales bacterium]